MGRRRHPDLTDYQTLLTSTGDVSVGAYARRQQRRRMLIGVFGGLLIAVAGVLVWAFLPPHTFADDHYEAHVQCIRCGWTGVARFKAGGPEQSVCPRCEERSCRQLWNCRDCGESFVPPTLGQTLSCPKCGGTRVGLSLSR